jgi:hypothetical protein
VIGAAAATVVFVFDALGLAAVTDFLAGTDFFVTLVGDTFFDGIEAWRHRNDYLPYQTIRLSRIQK